MKIRKIQPTNCSIPGCNYQTWRNAHTCFQHTVPPRETLERVYQAVRATPRASLREIGHQLKLSPSTVNRALWEFNRVGAVRKPCKVARGLVVLPAAICENQPYYVLWLDNL